MKKRIEIFKSYVQTKRHQNIDDLNATLLHGVYFVSIHWQTFKIYTKSKYSILKFSMRVMYLRFQVENA